MTSRTNEYAGAAKLSLAVMPCLAFSLLALTHVGAARAQEGNLPRRAALAGPTIQGALSPAENGAAAGEEVQVVATPGGGLQIQVGGETYFIETVLSYPGEGRIAYNSWPCLPKSSGEAGWKPAVRKIDARTLEVQSEGNGYRFTRQVKITNHRIELSDDLRNKTGEPLGVKLRHDLLTLTPPTAQRIQGVDEASVRERTSPENPTAYVGQQKTGIGALIEDSVLRLQMGSQQTADRTRLVFNHLGLAPNAGRAMRWSIYPVARTGSPESSDGYYRFVNSVRRDWKVNFPVPGPFEFVDARRLKGPNVDAYVQERVVRRGAKVLVVQPWFEYYSGADLSRDQYQALMKNAMTVLKKADPEVKILAALETNLTPVPLSFFGDALPSDTPFGRPGNTITFGKIPGKYGYEAQKPATERVNASKWNDSVLRNAEGNVLLDTWYVNDYKSQKLNLMVYPLPNNHWHQQMLDKIRFVLDDVGCDGVYFDQFSYAFNLSGRFVEDRWDNATVDIDDRTGRITRRYTDLGLATSEARIAWVKEVLRRNKLAIANTTAAVTEEQSLPMVRFMETQGYDAMGATPPNAKVCAKGQLGSPVGLGYFWGRGEGVKLGAPFFVRTVAAQLRYGLLYYYYSPEFPAEGERGGDFGPVKQMFPLTPVELGEGFVVGKERIVTCVSRTFNWPAAQKPKVMLFDERGRSRAAEAGQVQVAQKSGRWDVSIKLRDWWQIAVVE